MSAEERKRPLVVNEQIKSEEVKCRLVSHLILSLGLMARPTYKIKSERVLMTPNEKQTHRTAVSLLFGLLVVEGLVPLVLRLPGVLQDGAEDGLEQQDAQVDYEEGIHGPETGNMIKCDARIKNRILTCL